MAHTYEELLTSSAATWLEEEANRLGAEQQAQAVGACYDELGALLTGDRDALSDTCQEVLSRDEDGAPLVADNGVMTFLSEWWWLLGLGFFFFAVREG